MLSIISLIKFFIFILSYYSYIFLYSYVYLIDKDKYPEIAVKKKYTKKIQKLIDNSKRWREWSKNNKGYKIKTGDRRKKNSVYQPGGREVEIRSIKIF